MIGASDGKGESASGAGSAGNDMDLGIGGRRICSEGHVLVRVFCWKFVKPLNNIPIIV